MMSRVLRALALAGRVRILGLVALIGLAHNSWADNKDSMQFDVPILQEAKRHLELLEYPAYLAVALDNNNVGLGGAGKIMILDGKTLQYKTATLRFVEKKGPLYRYEGSVDWGIGMVQTSFKMPIEVDVSSMNQGKINVRVHLPLAKLFPQELTDRIRLKVTLLADLSLQKKMLEYFDALEKKPVSGAGIEGTANLIMIQAYNLQASRAGDSLPREPGDAEPLPDQFLLLITLAIWLVIVPSVALGQYLWRKHRRRPTA